MSIKNSNFVACHMCFDDPGLRISAASIGTPDKTTCPNCHQSNTNKLSLDNLLALAYIFFVLGSTKRFEYGAAPLIQFNQHQKTSIDLSRHIKGDIEIFERILGIGFFDYGPHMWMVGEVEPLKQLLTEEKQDVFKKILEEYPSKSLKTTDVFYRIRTNPSSPSNPLEYDSPPHEYLGNGRLDSKSTPILYCSPDLELCIHECRASSEDELYFATLSPTSTLNLLDLSFLLQEEVTEFESLDMAIYMLFLASKHSYTVSRYIAKETKKAGFDGLIYPSYFSMLRHGNIPFETVYGISQRRISDFQQHEQSKSIPNYAFFGRPISESKIKVSGINRLILRKVNYSFHCGPVI